MDTHINSLFAVSFQTVLIPIDPFKDISNGILDTVFRLPGIIGQPLGKVVHRFSTEGERGIKLYVIEYVALPPETCVGTFIDKSKVEF
jgi:hypothetical protein